MAEPGAEEPDERLLLLAEPAPQGGPPWRGPQGAKAAPGGAVRLCGELGLEEEEEEGEEDSGPEGDGEDQPLLRASGTGRGRRAGAAWDKEPRVAAGTARGRRRLLRRARLAAEGSRRGVRWRGPGQGGLARGGLPGCRRGRGSPCPVLPAGREKRPQGLKYARRGVPCPEAPCAAPGSSLRAWVGGRGQRCVALARRAGSPADSRRREGAVRGSKFFVCRAARTRFHLQQCPRGCFSLSSVLLGLALFVSVIFF